MPYISPERREEILSGQKDIDSPDRNAGDLNFCFTEIINAYREGNGDSYQTFNDIVGALEGAKLEFYRRVVAPYEDQAIKRNGDVY